MSCANTGKKRQVAMLCTAKPRWTKVSLLKYARAAQLEVDIFQFWAQSVRVACCRFYVVSDADRVTMVFQVHNRTAEAIL